MSIGCAYICRPVCDSGATRRRPGQGCIQRQRRKCPRNRWKDVARPLRDRPVAGGRVRGVCGTVRSVGRGRSTPWPGYVMSNTVQAYKRQAEVQKVHSQPSCPETQRNRTNAGASGASRFNGYTRRPEIRTDHAGKDSPGSDSGPCSVHGFHGPGRSSGATARQPVRFPCAEGVTPFKLALPAGVRVCGGALARHATRTLPGIAPKGGFGW